MNLSDSLVACIWIGLEPEGPTQPVLTGRRKNILPRDTSGLAFLGNASRRLVKEEDDSFPSEAFLFRAPFTDSFMK